MSKFQIGTLALLACTVALAADGGDAGQATSDYVKAARGPSTRSDPGVTVYTNAVLAAMYGTSAEGPAGEGSSFTTEDLVDRFGEPSAPAPADEAQPDASPEQPGEGYDPLAALQKEQAEKAARAEKIRALEAEVGMAQQKVNDLNVQLLATRNPFSARPDLSEKEKEERAASGETASQRYERTKQMVAEAEAELQAAQDKLAQARAGN